MANMQLKQSERRWIQGMPPVVHAVSERGWQAVGAKDSRPSKEYGTTVGLVSWQNELTGPKAKWQWATGHEALLRLSQAMVEVPVIALSNAYDVFILDMDALDWAAGAELCQLHEGGGAVISICQQSVAFYAR